MSLDEEFECLYDDYEKGITKGESLEAKNNLRKELLNRFAKYDNQLNSLSPENRISYYHFFATYHQFNAANPDEAERYYRLALEEAHTINPNDTPCIDESSKTIMQPGFCRKKGSLKRLYQLYNDLGFLMLEKNSPEALDLFKKGISYNIKDVSLKNLLQKKQVYFYRRINQYLIQDLVNEELTVINPEKFNDPVDCPFFSIRKRRSKKGKDDILISAYRFLKIQCFVKSRKDDKESDEYRNTLMWSHYADSHKGICIRYSFDPRFLFGDEKNGIANRWGDVSYKAKKFVYDEDKSSYTLEEMFATKKPCWKYEREIRLLHYDPNHDSSFKALPLGNNGKIEAVYFGLKCPEKDAETIIKILGKKVAYFKMKEDEEDIFKLVEVPLNEKAKAMLATSNEVEAKPSPTED